VPKDNQKTIKQEGHDASCPYINSETSGPALVKTGDTCPSRRMIVPDLLNQLTR